MKYINILEIEKQACEAVPSFTRIHGHPTREDRNKLREEVMQALSVPDMTLFENSHGDFGLLGKSVGTPSTHASPSSYSSSKPSQQNTPKTWTRTPATSRGGK